MTHKLLVLLQNPYAKGTLAAGWHPSNWKREFLSSRSGKRIQPALPTSHQPDSKGERWRVHYSNSNPQIGRGSSSEFLPDLAHVRRTIRRLKPDCILACGFAAIYAAAEAWPGALFCVPHPAHRLVTNALFEQCGETILRWGILRNHPEWAAGQDESPRIRFVQLRDRVDTITVDL